MTSTISSNKTKKPFLSMMLWSLKKVLPVTVIYSFLLFVCYPIYITLTRNSDGNNFDYGRCQMILIQVVPMIISVFTIITACVMFGVYHKKRSVDLYASLPINKTTLFLSKYVSGLLAIIVPLVIFMSLGLLLSFQVTSINVFITYFRMLGYIVGIINIYSMLAFLAMICGGTVDTLVTFGVINVGVVGCLLSGANLVASIVPGLYNMDIQIYEPFTYMLLFSFSPFAVPFLSDSGLISYSFTDSNGSLIKYVNDEFFSTEAKVLVIWFILGIVYFVAGMIMAKKRKNENVQNGFIFNFPKVIIQVIATLSAGVMAGGFLAGNYCTKFDGFKTMLMFMLGALLGSVLAYLIVTLVYNKGPKRYIKGLPAFIGSFVAVAVFYLAISTGLVGVSNVPKVESIKSVCVLGENDHTFNTELAPIIHSKADGFEKANLFIEDKEVIKNTVALHQAIVDGLHEEAGAFFNFYNYFTAGGGDSYTGYEPYTIRIEYELNNGKKISKTYIFGYFDYVKIKDKFNAVISSDIYKQECYKLVKCATAYEANVTAIDFNSTLRYTAGDNSKIDSAVSTETAVDVDKSIAETVHINDENAVGQVYSTLREEFIADKNCAETLEAKYCEYVEPTESNSEIYDEIVFNINIAYYKDYFIDVYQAIDRQAESLGVIPGEYLVDPEENFVITKDTYPKTWTLLNSYCEKENTNTIYMHTNIDE